MIAFQPQIDTMVMDRRGKIKDEINHSIDVFLCLNKVATQGGVHILKIILSFCFNPGLPSIADIINYNTARLDEYKRITGATARQEYPPSFSLLFKRNLQRVFSSDLGPGLYSDRLGSVANSKVTPILPHQV